MLNRNAYLKSEVSTINQDSKCPPRSHTSDIPEVARVVCTLHVQKDELREPCWKKGGHCDFRHELDSNDMFFNFGSGTWDVRGHNSRTPLNDDVRLEQARKLHCCEVVDTFHPSETHCALEKHSISCSGWLPRKSTFCARLPLKMKLPRSPKDCAWHQKCDLYTFLFLSPLFLSFLFSSMLSWSSPFLTLLALSVLFSSLLFSPCLFFFLSFLSFLCGELKTPKIGSFPTELPLIIKTSSYRSVCVIVFVCLRLCTAIIIDINGVWTLC